MLALCFDVGNSQTCVGLLKSGKLIWRWNYPTLRIESSEQFVQILLSALREGNIAINSIQRIGICSVVPKMDPIFQMMCEQYFNIEPFFLLSSTQKILKIVKIKQPQQIGADLLASAITCCYKYPQHNAIIVDFGTITTFTALSADREFLGCAFIAGIELSLEAMGRNTSQLNIVPPIDKPIPVTGTTTTEAIQAGIYYGHLGAVSAIIQKMIEENFAYSDVRPLTIATGGLAHLFARTNIFTIIEPDWVLDGLFLTLDKQE